MKCIKFRVEFIPFVHPLKGRKKPHFYLPYWWFFMVFPHEIYTISGVTNGWKFYPKGINSHSFPYEIGSFTVAIFAYFSAPFQPTFWLLFVTLAEESTKGE